MQTIIVKGLSLQFDRLHPNMDPRLEAIEALEACNGVLFDLTAEPHLFSPNFDGRIDETQIELGTDSPDDPEEDEDGGAAAVCPACGSLRSGDVEGNPAPGSICLKCGHATPDDGDGGDGDGDE